MRTERPTPWGFDVWDPRLALREQAAHAQQASDGNTPDGDDWTALDEPEAIETREPETVGAGGVK